ncbi:MAG: hypothetical protein ACFB21_08140 [Opitutales bacterium]
MKSITVIFLAVLLAAASAWAATPARVLLIAAAEGNGDRDPRLAPYEANLRRIFRFDSFSLRSRASAQVSNKPSSVRLPGGMAVSLRETANGPWQIAWREGDQTLLRSEVTVRPGRPAVLGGPVRKGQTLILIVESAASP